MVTEPTCPARCCEIVGTVNVVKTRGERVDEVIFLDLATMDALREGEPWYGYMHDHMLTLAGRNEDGNETYGRCRLLDPKTNLCTIYDRRPQMCRTYPGDHACWYCTYDPARPDVPGVLFEVAFAREGIARSFE